MPVYFGLSQPDSLAGDDLETKVRCALSDLERARDHSLDKIQQEAAHWAKRFAGYAKWAKHLQESPETRHNFNSLGELQGNSERFDHHIVEFVALDEMLRYLRGLLDG